MLFTINLRLIQQIGASYGFRFGGPEARPLVLRIFSAAIADTPEARQDALGELRAAGAAIARGNAPTSSSSAGNAGMSGETGSASSSGTASSGEAASDGTSTEENQSRVLVNEIARDMAAREMAQLIPLAGAATGAGLNLLVYQRHRRDGLHAQPRALVAVPTSVVTCARSFLSLLRKRFGEVIRRLLQVASCHPVHPKTSRRGT